MLEVQHQPKLTTIKSVPSYFFFRFYQKGGGVKKMALVNDLTC